MWRKSVFVLFSIVLIFLIVVSLTTRVESSKNRVPRVLLSDVSAITLSKGKMTNSRRVAAIPQLKCVSGACGEYEPHSVLCQNVGSDGFDVQWKCSADLPGGMKLANTEVVCEGYDSPDDEYILRGSCGLEYALIGGSRAAHRATYDDSYVKSAQQKPRAAKSQTDWISGTIMTVVIAVISYWIYQACMRRHRGGNTDRNDQQQRRGFRLGDPPPPYNPDADEHKNDYNDDDSHSSATSSSSSWDDPPSCSSTSSRSEQSTSTGTSTHSAGAAANAGFGAAAPAAAAAAAIPTSFWAALLGGSLLGYMFGGLGSGWGNRGGWGGGWHNNMGGYNAYGTGVGYGGMGFGGFAPRPHYGMRHNAFGGGGFGGGGFGGGGGGGGGGGFASSTSFGGTRRR